MDPGDLVIEKLKRAPLIYKGEPVITLRQIDECFSQAEGTAKSRFHRMREELREGQHYHGVPYEEWSQLGSDELSLPDSGGHRGLIHLITHAGFIRLSMRFRGKEAARVRDHIEFHYFRSLSLPDRPLELQQYAELITRSLLPVVDRLAHGQGKIEERVETISQDVAGVKEDVHLIKRKLFRRTQIKPETKRRHALLCAELGGNCPACSRRRIVDEFANPLDGQLEYDHWYGPDRSLQWETWPVCRDCNQSFKDDGKRALARPRFEAYQSHLRESEERRGTSTRVRELFLEEPPGGWVRAPRHSPAEPKDDGN